jgi:hypothetical protein
MGRQATVRGGLQAFHQEQHDGLVLVNAHDRSLEFVCRPLAGTTDETLNVGYVGVCALSHVNEAFGAACEC